MKTETNRIQKEFNDYWKNEGFLEFSPISVISPPKSSNVLFTGSGFFHHLKKIGEEGYLKNSFVGTQPCVKFGFKGLSLSEMKARDGYFTFFRQLSCAVQFELSLEWLVNKVWYYLTQISGLNKQKLHVGVNRCNPEMKNYWIRAGAKPENVLFPDYSAMNFSISNLDLEAYYHPFAYDRGKDHILSCGKESCGINCNCERFLELGDIGIVRIGKVYFFDHGIGLERISSACLGLEKVTDIHEFLELSYFISSFYSVSWDYSLLLSDYLRTVLVLIDAGLTPSNKKQGYGLRNLLRQFFEIVPSKKLNETSLRFVSRRITESVGDIHSTSVEMTTEIMLSEYVNYQRLLKQGTKLLKRFIQKHGRRTLAEEEKEYFYQTHGLTYEVLQKIIAEL